MIISLDFDGVVHSYTSGWKGIDIIPDDPVPGAIDFIRRHLQVPDALGGCFEIYKGPVVQIFSSRSAKRSGRRAMKKWLIKHGLESEYISDNLLQFPTDKPPALLTIDDRAIQFKGFFPTDEEIKNFQPWNKRSDYELKVDRYLQRLKNLMIENKDITEIEFFEKLDHCAIFHCQQKTIGVNLDEFSDFTKQQFDFLNKDKQDGKL